MIWIYIITLTTTKPVKPDTPCQVHAPNIAFKSEEACQRWREHDMLRLYNSRPNESARVVSQCISLRFFTDGDDT